MLTKLLRTPLFAKQFIYIINQCLVLLFSGTWRCIIEAGEKFKHFGVAFTNDEMQNEELNVRLGKASAVMRALYHLVVLKRELSRKVKLSVFKSIFVPILTYGHEFCFVTERVRSQMQAPKMRLLRKIIGERSYDI